MAWLWLISVGVTDVQFPVWKRLEDDEWGDARLFDIGAGGCRAVHAGLLALLERNRICFPTGDLPKQLDREDAKNLKFDFAPIDDGFIATIKEREQPSSGFCISRYDDCIPNDHEENLPLYCPKVAEIVDAACATFTNEPVTVVVLNTRRDETSRHGKNEPIASGPLVANFLASRLGLDPPGADHAGAFPASLEHGTCTWVDILTGTDAVEDDTVLQGIVPKVIALADAWKAKGSRKVMITSSGGIPNIKPIVERVAATVFGQSAITLLHAPERGMPKGTAQPETLRFEARVTEREALRFHCAEGLRQGDYAGAYGLASRSRTEAWSGHVLNRLGPLLELPGNFDYGLEPLYLTACQIDIALCIGDPVRALLRLATFVEMANWELIACDARIIAWGLQVDPTNECLCGNLAEDHPMFERGLLQRNAKGPHRHKNIGRAPNWASWLCQRAGKNQQAAKQFDGLQRIYERAGLRALRNVLIHVRDPANAAVDVYKVLEDSRLVAAMGAPFGWNFLNAEIPAKLLESIDGLDSTKAVGNQLRTLLDDVVRA